MNLSSWSKSFDHKDDRDWIEKLKMVHEHCWRTWRKIKDIDNYKKKLIWNCQVTSRSKKEVWFLLRFCRTWSRWLLDWVRRRNDPSRHACDFWTTLEKRSAADFGWQLLDFCMEPVSLGILNLHTSKVYFDWAGMILFSLHGPPGPRMQLSQVDVHLRHANNSLRYWTQSSYCLSYCLLSHFFV